ncbi:MAG TPA: phosphate ABC transporter permease PstA [Herpetosiphonaceae bacterium]|jgi:phosphate transport system permease protein|nr:phosphate ABC transporter permease PstA [Herpetosiphonaceae bacterium]
MKRQHVERVAFGCLWLAASLTIVILAIIVAYILQEGLPYISLEFLTGRPQEEGREGGILPAILGTLALGALSLVIAVPLGVGAAIFLTEYTRPNLLTTIMRFGTDSLAGVPSIIFGLFGFIFFVTRLHLSWSLLAGALTLALMVLPTIIRTTEEAIRAVPVAYREVSYGLGASRWQMVQTVVLPSALPGIITGVILSFGRAVGETAAVIFTAGTALNIPTSIFSPTRTMAVHFYILAVEGISLPKAYATGAVLIITILIINVGANALITRGVARSVRR